MTSENKTSRRSSRRSRSVSEIDRKRRSLAKVGLSAPVLMTLSSRPALAKRCSPSVLASGNLSDPVETATCGTCTNHQWLNAKLRDFQDCGIQDPSLVELNSLFIIPDIRTLLLGNQPIISGSCLDALQGNCVIPDELIFVDSQNNWLIPQSAGRQILSNLMCYAMAVVLNGLNPTTSMNVTYSTSQVVSDVNSVLVVGSNKKIDADQLALMEQECAFLMSDGSSCALI